MKSQAYNPYLPSWEYVPDGEPHVFGDRVYVYGSHDKFNAPIFCVNDYVCWSAPVDDMSDWRYEGVIYRKDQDPKNRLSLRLLFAPDVCLGADGRYYLYYAFDFMGVMGVAMCDTPAGQYQFLGHVHYPDGTVVELEQDMVTIKGEPKVIFPQKGSGSFPNHEFFEASSIRKDGDRYIVWTERRAAERRWAV